MTRRARQQAAGRGSRPRAARCCAQMLRIRRFEENCAELYSADKIRGFLHLYIGEEAVAVGAMQALEPEDAHRRHLPRARPCAGARRPARRDHGGDVRQAEGCSRGRGGSMHLFDAATRFYGGNAIVGGGLPLAVGLALPTRCSGRPRVTACFFGEGAVAEGEFHESHESRRAVEAAGAVLLREQSLRHGHGLGPL